MKVLFLFLIVNFSFSVSSQEKEEWNHLFKAETFIYLNKMDSASIELTFVKTIENTRYLESLHRIVTEKHSNKDVWIFIQKTISNNLVDELKKNQFIESMVKLPLSKTKINLDYVRVRCEEHYFLMNSNLLKEGNSVLNSLKKYISSIDKNDSNDWKHVEFLMNRSDIVYHVIKRNVEQGEQLCGANKEIALELHDTLLIELAANNNAEFLIYKSDLKGYISLMEEVIRLGDAQKEKSSIYFKNLFNLIGSRMFNDEDPKKIIPLIKILYYHPRFKIESYYLIIEMLKGVDGESDFYSWAMDEFEANDVVELTEKAMMEAEEKLYPNDVYQVARVSANLLLKEGFTKEAFKMKDESISFLKTIYSKNLSKAIAEHEIKKNELANELSLSIEKEKSNFYWSIMFTSFTVLVILLFGVFLLRRKNSTLKKQKLSIEKKDYEKQLLLKEIHHRVKNNFQIVSSILQLQTKGIEDQKAIGLAIEGQNRVKAMALIHQKLYQNDELAVRFQDYVQSLVSDINKAYSNTKVTITTEISPDYTLDIDTAIPLGLILNELITNSFKYAFSPDRENSLEIELIQGKKIQRLSVSDNGPGIDSSIDLKKVKSIGLRLVKNLAKQLHGSFTYEKKGGAKFLILFKETSYRELED